MFRRRRLGFFAPSTLKISIPQCVGDRTPNAVEFSIDFRVPEAQDRKTAAFKHSIPLAITLPVILETVLRTVDLDNQPSVETSEVDDVSTQRNLSTKLPPALTITKNTQMRPKLHLLWRHLFAQAARNFVRHGDSPARP
jgi:hypothetical protein